MHFKTFIQINPASSCYFKNIPVFWRTSSSKTVESPQASPAPPVAHVEERPRNGRGLQIWSKCLGGQIWQCFLGKVILMTKDERWEEMYIHCRLYICIHCIVKYCQDGLRQQLFWCLFPWTPWEKGYDCIYMYILNICDLACPSPKLPSWWSQITGHGTIMGWSEKKDTEGFRSIWLVRCGRMTS